MQPSVDLETYARLLAKFTHSPEVRPALLASHGLTEESWSELDEYWQECINEEEDPQEGSVTPLLVRFTEAFSQAQLQLAGARMSLESYAEILRQVQGGRELNKLLSDERINLATYLGAHVYWTKQAAEDESIRDELQSKLSEPQSSRRRV